MPRLLVAAMRRTNRPTLSAVLPRPATAPRIAAPAVAPSPSTSTYLQRSAPTFTSALRGRITSSRPSIASAATSQITTALLADASAVAAAPTLQGVRLTTYGAEYQPNQLKRKRTHGFLARLKSRGGRKILKRRRAKGKRFLTH